MQLLGIGLQLSYLGTIGIIIFSKNIKKFLDNLKIIKNNLKIEKSNLLVKTFDNFKEMLSVTLSAQIMIFPVMLYHFNIIGIYFIITNILVSIIIGPIVILGIVIIMISFINLQIAKFISFFLSLGIECLIQISNLSSLPFSKLYVITPNILLIIIYYIFILTINQIYIIYSTKNINNTKKRVKNIIALVKYNLYQKKKKAFKQYTKIIKEKNLKLLLLKTYKIIIVLMIVFLLNYINKDLKIHFLDVGQGDSCFIITPNNKTILIDGGGTSSSFNVGRDILLPYILDRGYKDIDYIFISHFDQDHVRFNHIFIT